jgi:hypothetical protein
MLAPWWLVVPALCALAAIVVGLVRRPRPAVLPVADASALGRPARRTTAIRIALLAAIGAILAAAFLVAPRPTGRLEELVSSGGTTVVVLDMSQSVSDLVYREISRTLEGIVTAAGDKGRVGLVLFSDVAEEALPPGSRAADLLPFVKYFRPKNERGLKAKPIYYRNAGPTATSPTRYPLNPWYGRFSGGTQISAGLRVARVALERDHAGGRVILLSDLAESDYDIERLGRELVAYQQNPALELRIVALPPATASQKQLFARITGDGGSIVDSLSLATGNETVGEPAEGMPVVFLVVVGVLALALAANELLGVPLAFRSGAPGVTRT